MRTFGHTGAKWSWSGTGGWAPLSDGDLSAKKFLTGSPFLSSVWMFWLLFYRYNFAWMVVVLPSFCNISLNFTTFAFKPLVFPRFAHQSVVLPPLCAGPSEDITVMRMSPDASLSQAVVVGPDSSPVLIFLKPSFLGWSDFLYPWIWSIRWLWSVAVVFAGSQLPCRLTKSSNSWDASGYSWSAPCGATPRRKFLRPSVGVLSWAVELRLGQDVLQGMLSKKNFLNFLKTGKIGHMRDYPNSTPYYVAWLSSSVEVLPCYIFRGSTAPWWQFQQRCKRSRTRSLAWILHRYES